MFFATFYVICFIYCILIFILAIGWIKIPLFKSSKLPSTKVSIIVPFRNEEKQLKKCLEELILQDYPQHLFEIIAVDDHSEDLSSSIVNQLIEKYPKKLITLINMNNLPIASSFKKMAIAKAVNQSVGDLIITTDADCFRNSQWLKEIVSFYEQNQYKMIVAPVVYLASSLFGKMQALEFMSLAAVTGAGINIKQPLMCNGANIAWQKQAFLDVDGFMGNEHILSGDDVYLMQKFNKYFTNSIGYIKSLNASVSTQPCESIRQFFSQRVRWAGKNKLQPNFKTIIVGLLVLLQNLSILTSLILGIFIPNYINVFFKLLIFKSIADLSILIPTSLFFKNKMLLLYFPIVQLSYIFYVPITGIYSLFGKTTWKGRVVH